MTLDGDFVAKVMDWSGGRGVDAVIDNLGGEILPRISMHSPHTAGFCR